MYLHDYGSWIKVKHWGKQPNTFYCSCFEELLEGIALGKYKSATCHMIKSGVDIGTLHLKYRGGTDYQIDSLNISTAGRIRATRIRRRLLEMLEVKKAKSSLPSNTERVIAFLQEFPTRFADLDP